MASGGQPTRLGAAGRLGRRVVRRLTRAQLEPLAAQLEGLSATVSSLVRSSPNDEAARVALAADLGTLRYSASARRTGEGMTGTIAAFLESPGPVAAMPAVVDVDTDVGPLYIAAHDEAILAHLRRDGAWEPLEAAAIQRVVTPGMTVLDLGAHVGYRTILLSRLVGAGGRVIAVEAFPANFALLNANLHRHGVTNVLTLPLAAGERAGTVELAISDTNTGDNRLFARPGEQVVTVEMQPLGELLPPSINLDFIKSDLQGYDQRALRGMEGTLRRHPPAIVVEFCPRDIRQVGDDPVATLAFYRDLGYGLSVIEVDTTTASDDEVLARAAAAEHEYVNLLLTRQDAP